jgi:hypothetical protein
VLPKSALHIIKINKAHKIASLLYLKNDFI